MKLARWQGAALFAAALIVAIVGALCAYESAVSATEPAVAVAR